MLTVIETPTYLRSVSTLWSEEEALAFVEFISESPLAGDVIVGTRGLRKVRWSRPGMGRRGGARVVYYLRLAGGEVVLLIAHAKAKFDKLPTEFLNRLKETYDV